MNFRNIDGMWIADTFIRLYGDAIRNAAPHYNGEILFRSLRREDNDFGDIMVRIGKTVFVSESEVGKIGLTDPEVLAALAHEVGHIVYSTHGWQPDCEHRADMLAAEIGLGGQMISAIERLIDSRRFAGQTSSLVGRIHFLQNMLRGEDNDSSCRSLAGISVARS